MIVKTIFLFLYIYVVDLISLIFLSKLCYKKCEGVCSNCKMWSCTYDTEYKNYRIVPYNDFSNVCGKRKGLK